MKVKRFTVVALISGCVLAACQGGSPNSATTSSPTNELYAKALAIAPNVSLALISGTQLDCNFNNAALANGNSVTAFQNSSVAFGQTCVSEARLCTDGVLSGSFQFASCAVQAPASCLFNGQTIASGSSLLAYASTNIALGAECFSETRVCTDGVLSGSFQFASCNINLPVSCLFNGQTILSGQTVPAYSTSSVAFGQTCTLEQRLCDNGTLSGANQYASCVVNQAASCLFNGQTIADGQSVPAFLNSSEAVGGICAQETRVCSNGILSGSYQFGSCVVNQPASCLFNGQTIAHGDSVNAYQSSSVDYAQMCIAESRTCDNGHLSGSFQFASCDVGQAASCLFNGRTIVSGDSVTAFLSSNVAGSGTCNSEQRLCTNGVLSGSNAFDSCTVTQATSCLFNQQTILNGQKVIAYKESDSKDDCDSETRICKNGVLSGSFTNTSCNTKNCSSGNESDSSHHNGRDAHDYEANFQDDQVMIQVCKYVVDIKHDEKIFEKHNASLSSTEYKHKEKYDCGLNLGWYKHKQNENSCGKKKSWYRHHAEEENHHH